MGMVMVVAEVQAALMVNHGVQIVVGMVVTAGNTVAAAVLVETIQALYHLQTAAAVEQSELFGPELHVHSHQQTQGIYK